METPDNNALNPDVAASLGSAEGVPSPDTVVMPTPTEDGGQLGMFGGMASKVVDVFKSFTSHQTVARLLASNRDSTIVAMQQQLGDMVLDAILDRVLPGAMPDFYNKYLVDPRSIWRSVAKVAIGNIMAAVLIQFESYDKRIYIIADSVVKGANSHWVRSIRLLESVQFLFDTSVWKLAGEILAKTTPAQPPQQ